MVSACRTARPKSKPALEYSAKAGVPFSTVNRAAPTNSMSPRTPRSIFMSRAASTPSLSICRRAPPDMDNTPARSSDELPCMNNDSAETASWVNPVPFLSITATVRSDPVVFRRRLKAPARVKTPPAWISTESSPEPPSDSAPYRPASLPSTSPKVPVARSSSKTGKSSVISSVNSVRTSPSVSLRRIEKLPSRFRAPSRERSPEPDRPR